MREESGGGCSPPHARSLSIDHSERASERTEGRRCEMRRDLHLRWSCEAENEVHEVSEEADEH